MFPVEGQTLKHCSSDERERLEKMTVAGWRGERGGQTSCWMMHTQSIQTFCLQRADAGKCRDLSSTRFI